MVDVDSLDRAILAYLRDSARAPFVDIAKNVNVNPTTKQYSVVLTSKDENANVLENVNWTVLSSDSVSLDNGNTGLNSLDTANFSSTYPSLDIIIKSNKSKNICF